MVSTSRFLPVRLEHASRLINHGPTVLVTSASGGRRNVMAAAWSMPVNFEPPQIAVVIDRSTFTRELVEASGTFGICIPGRAICDQVYAFGSTSGRDGDKFERFKLDVLTGPQLGMPVIEDGCAAWLECRMLPEPRTERLYDTFFGEVVAAAADPRAFENGRWSIRPDNSDLHSIHHLGGGVFVAGGEEERAAPARPA